MLHKDRLLHIGKQVVFYCKQCKELVTEVIPADGHVKCSICGFTPKQESVTLAMGERRKLVDELFSSDTEITNYILSITDLYAQDIDNETFSKKSCCYYYGLIWNCISNVATYILSSPDNQFEGVYSDKNLERKQYRKGRKNNCYGFSFFRENNDMNDCGDNDNQKLTSDEYIDKLAYQFNGTYDKWFYNPNFDIKDFMENLTDTSERTVVAMLYYGYSKKEIAKYLNQSETGLQTIIGHIAKHLLEPPTQSTQVKECSCCHTIKFSTEFSVDRRNNDGLQSICKECDKARKKLKKNTGKLPKSA